MPNLSARLRNYLRQRESPLANHVPDLIRAGRRHRVDPRLIVAIAGAETSLAKAGQGPSVFNAWGIGPGRAYSSWGEGINEMAKLLRSGYLDEGRTSFTALYPKYVWGKTTRDGDPEADWVRNASAVYSDLGGNPRNVSRGWKVGSAPAASRVRPSRAAPQPPEMPELPLLQFSADALARIAQGGSAVSALGSLLDAPERWKLEHPAPAPTARVPAPRNGPRRQGGNGLPARSVPSVQPDYSSLKLGKVIGTPHAGTHSLGNWQSDNAYDVAMPVGTPIRADFDGVVGDNIGSLGASKGSRFEGSRVQVNGKGNSAWYGHLSRYIVRPGQRVKKGQVIGFSGSANGVPHLHVGYLHLPR